MSLLLGVAASVLIGISDTFGRASSRRAEPISHVSMQMAVGVLVAVPVALLLRNEIRVDDLAMGLVSGALIALGLSLLYRAMAESSSAVAAPAASVLVALIPLIWDLLGGAELSSLAALGCVIALASLVLTTYSPTDSKTSLRGLGLAALAGVFLGVSVIFAADTNPDSGAWPAASQRLAGFVAMLMLARLRSVPAFLPPGIRRFGYLGGVAGALGMISWIIGAQLGELGVVSIVASTSPAVVALLATKFDEDTIRPLQALGVAGAIAGTILIVLS